MQRATPVLPVAQERGFLGLEWEFCILICTLPGKQRRDEFAISQQEQNFIFQPWVTKGTLPYPEEGLQTLRAVLTHNVGPSVLTAAHLGVFP